MASGHEIQVDTTLDRRETSAQTSGECHDSLNRLTVTIHRARCRNLFMRPFGPMFVFQKGNLSHEYLSVNGQFLRHLDGANCFSPPHL